MAKDTKFRNEYMARFRYYLKGYSRQVSNYLAYKDMESFPRSRWLPSGDELYRRRRRIVPMSP